MDDLEQEQTEMRERMARLAEQKKALRPLPFGQHYRIRDLARGLGMSATTVRRIFENEPGVIKVGHTGSARVRRHISLYIPEYVVRRVYERLRKGMVQVSPARSSRRKKDRGSQSRPKKE